MLKRLFQPSTSIFLLLLGVDCALAQDSTICATANEGTSAIVTCPDGYVVTAIDFASYGTPDAVCGAFTLGDCHAPTSVAIVSDLCLGHRSRAVCVSNEEFGGDPCYGTFKRLFIQARCSPGLPANPICGEAREDCAVHLAAPAGQVFTHIDFASYGTPTGTCGAFQRGACDAANSRVIVEEQCLGRSDCTISATPGTFGDPCFGIVKKLIVQATYGDGTVAAQRASWGRLKALYR